MHKMRRKLYRVESFDRQHWNVETLLIRYSFSSNMPITQDLFYDTGLRIFPPYDMPYLYSCSSNVTTWQYMAPYIKAKEISWDYTIPSSIFPVSSCAA